MYRVPHLRNMAAEDTAAVVEAASTVVGAAEVSTAVVAEAARITAEAVVGTTAERRLVRIAARRAEWRVGIARTVVRADTLRAVTADRPTAAHARMERTADARREIRRMLATAARLLQPDATAPTGRTPQDARTV